MTVIKSPSSNLPPFLLWLFFVCFFRFFAKEAEENHPELLALPDEIQICQKAAGYRILFLFLFF